MSGSCRCASTAAAYCSLPATVYSLGLVLTVRRRRLTTAAPETPADSAPGVCPDTGSWHHS